MPAMSNIIRQLWDANASMLPTWTRHFIFCCYFCIEAPRTLMPQRQPPKPGCSSHTIAYHFEAPWMQLT
eukprot:1158973-Pelagomonas_calceolata.AAC.6